MTNWNDINITEIMISTVFGLIIGEIWSFIKRKYAEYEPIKKLKNVKVINILWFVLVYISPIVTIFLSVIQNNTEPTFKNIALFIVICVTLVYNFLMSHVIAIYKMIKQLAKSSSDKMNQVDTNFRVINKNIEFLNENKKSNG
jgi:putative flippase GtrA